MKSQINYEIALITLFGLLGSMLIGFIFFTTNIFNPHFTSFQFMSFGLFGSLFYCMFEFKNTKEQILLFLIVFILNIIIFTGKAISLAYLVGGFFFLAALFLAVKFYFQFLKRNSTLKYYLRCLALAFMYGITNSICGFLAFIINTKGNFPSVEYLIMIARFGVLIGAGIGLGIDFYFQNRKHLFNLLKIKAV